MLDSSAIHRLLSFLEMKIYDKSHIRSPVGGLSDMALFMSRAGLQQCLELLVENLL